MAGRHGVPGKADGGMVWTSGVDRRDIQQARTAAPGCCMMTCSWCEVAEMCASSVQVGLGLIDNMLEFVERGKVAEVT